MLGVASGRVVRLFQIQVAKATNGQKNGSAEENTNNLSYEHEEWMILSDIHQTFNQNVHNSCSDSYNWQTDSTKYTQQQLGEMPSWIKWRKGDIEQRPHS